MGVMKWNYGMVQNRASADCTARDQDPHTDEAPRLRWAIHSCFFRGRHPEDNEFSGVYV